MARTKPSTIQKAPKTKNGRKQQLKNAAKCKKKVTETPGPRQVSESQPVLADQQHHVLPSTSIDNDSDGKSDNILGEKTRTQFKQESYKTILSCEADTSAALLASADQSACGGGGGLEVECVETLDRKNKRGVVDFVEVGELIKTLCCPQCSNSGLAFITDSKEPRGLAVHGQVYCATCQEPVAERFLASRGDGPHSKSFVINRQAVYSSLVCGMGATTFNNFCENMDLQGVHHKTFHAHANKLYSNQDDLEKRVFSQTVKHIRQVHAQHQGITLGEEDNLDISVSFDGTWLTRGHSSHIGVGCVVDLLTGLCVDTYVMCTYCQVCESTGKKMLRDKPDDHAQWLVQHLPNCDKNFSGK